MRKAAAGRDQLGELSEERTLYIRRVNYSGRGERVVWWSGFLDHAAEQRSCPAETRGLRVAMSRGLGEMVVLQGCSFFPNFGVYAQDKMQ